MALSSANGGMSGYSSSGGSHVALASRTGGAMAEVDQYSPDAPGEYWSLARKKNAYVDYLFSKRLEIDEQQDNRRYRHGAQWTARQISIFNDRRQPVVTFNEIGPKLDGIVGEVEKSPATPRCIPRAPRFQQSADLATASLRASLELTKWKQKSPKCAATGTVDGIGGVEFQLRQGPQGYEIDLDPVDIEGFFYDPRSKLEDFSDALYMGCGRWVDADVLKELIPGKDKEIDAAIGSGYELTSTSDHDNVWFTASGNLKSVRLVYICYQHKGEWYWGLFTRASTLMEGKSNFLDRDGKTVCSYVMYSAAVDHDGDRYGFVRQLKSAQDEVNQRRSKGLHEQNSRRIFAEAGAFDDIEKARKEAVRPDGVVIRNKGYEAEFDDAKKQQDIVGQLKFLEDARAELRGFGPDLKRLAVEGISNRSGRAVHLLQRAGMSELGPYVLALSNWKLRVYEQMFYAIKKWWTNERWIRVTDDENVQQMVQINAMQIGPMGMPQIVNSLAELDVDIVLDEGGDNATMMEDFFEALATIVPAIAPMLSPPEVRAVMEMLIESNPMLPAEAKRKFKQASLAAQQPDPVQQAAQQIELAKGQATAQKDQTQAQLNIAKANEANAKAMAPPPQQQMEFQLPPELLMADKLADIGKKQAEASHINTKSSTEASYAMLEPIDYVQQAHDAMFQKQYDIADLAMRKYEADSARQSKAKSQSQSK